MAPGPKIVNHNEVGIGMAEQNVLSLKQSIIAVTCHSGESDLVFGQLCVMAIQASTNTLPMQMKKVS